MNLTSRLKTIYEKVPTGSSPVDVGTDHCYIPIALFKNRKCSKVIATELNMNAYRKAIETVKKEELLDVIDIRLGDGLKVIKPGEIDIVIIAGMGGTKIINILKSSPEVLKHTNLLILQPMTAQARLRHYLLNSGYKIIDEDLAKEQNRIYEIITVVRGKGFVEDELYYEIGYNLIKEKHPLLLEYIDQKIISTRNIINSIRKSNSKTVEKKLNRLQKRLNKLEGVKRDVCKSSNNNANN
ncbi:MAG TPA: SAM-dependent methyltransferase [Thermoanaerobacterales bacterium]|nr:SAM-dependent methyltransferase [Thermoanaerobacterales bacterium]